MYKLNINKFEGPLDLLLSLIQKNKLDICEISINQIADDFLDTVAKMEVEDIDMISDFIYISSKLIEIKSRYMLFISHDEDDENELVLSLEEYAKYKKLSETLKKMYVEGCIFFEKITDEIFAVEELDFSKLTVDSMLNSIKINENHEQEQLRFTRKQKPLNEKIDYISKYMQEKKQCHFDDIVENDKKDEKVVSMLGVLHLVKENRINVKQHNNFDTIAIKLANN